MTTRAIAAVAEKLSLLADEMNSAAVVLFAGTSRTPAQPHLLSLCQAARRAALTLTILFPKSDDARHMAGEIDSWREVWLDRMYMPPNMEADLNLAIGMEYAARFIAEKAQELRSLGMKNPPVGVWI